MRKGVVIALALMILLIPGALSAQDQGAPKMVCKEACEKALQLSEEQRVKLAALKLEHKIASIELGAELKILNLKMEQELSKDDPSAKELDGLVSKISAAREKLHKKKIDHLLQLKKILKPEQLKHFSSCCGGMGGHSCMMMDCAGIGGCDMGGHSCKEMIVIGGGHSGTGACAPMGKCCSCKCCGQMMGGSCCAGGMGGMTGCAPAMGSCKETEHRCIKIKTGE